MYAAVRDQLKEIGIKKVEKFDSPDDLLLVRWRRECLATWNAAERRFVRHPNDEMRVEEEATILMYIDVKELSTIEHLLERVAMARAAHHGASAQVRGSRVC